MIAELNAFISREAACRASLMVKTGAFSANDWLDLKQELTIDCWRRGPKFDSARGEWTGFVRGVIRNQSTVLFKRQIRRGREVGLEEVGDGDGVYRPEGMSDDPAESFALSLDVRQAVRNLAPPLQVLALHLTAMTVSEICDRTGKSRSRVYQLIRDIRAAFMAAGLQPHGHRARRKRVHEQASVAVENLGAHR